MPEILDNVELPLPEKVALDVAPLPVRVLISVLPMPLTVRALVPILSDDEKFSLRFGVASELVIESDLELPSKFTFAANVLFAEPSREIEDEVPPSRFSV
jgi:hypothetical protein